jgi:hypothetical protein
MSETNTLPPNSPRFSRGVPNVGKLKKGWRRVFPIYRNGGDYGSALRLRRRAQPRLQAQRVQDLDNSQLSEPPWCAVGIRFPLPYTRIKEVFSTVFFHAVSPLKKVHLRRPAQAVGAPQYGRCSFPSKNTRRGERNKESHGGAGH